MEGGAVRFNPRIWVPIAWVLAAVNVGATWFAASAAEPAHATVHAGLAVAFALWARRMSQRGAASLRDLEDHVAELQAESRGEIAELQERLDFAERLLAQERMRQGVRPPEP